MKMLQKRELERHNRLKNYWAFEIILIAKNKSKHN